MNASEKIQAAIERLEGLKAASTQGKWAVSAKQLDIPGFMYAPSVCAGCGWDRDTDADADLIVTLHRTIDAQLAILREYALPAALLNEQCGAQTAGPLLALAEAILA